MRLYTLSQYDQYRKFCIKKAGYLAIDEDVGYSHVLCDFNIVAWVLKSEQVDNDKGWNLLLKILCLDRNFSSHDVYCIIGIHKTKNFIFCSYSDYRSNKIM
jgi:hypothetical protein